MTLPGGVWGWIGLIAHLVFALAPPGALILWLLAIISRHSICLSGQRISDDDDPLVLYRFAVQNNEDVPLAGKHRLRIRILDPDGLFPENTAPTVYAGCNEIHTSTDTDRRAWAMTFEELPAYETWTIDCPTNRHSRNVCLTIEESKPSDEGKGKASEPSPPGASRLTHWQLTLPADRTSVFVGRYTMPEFWWAALAVSSALCFYAAGIYLFVVLRHRDVTLADWGAALSIALFGLALWYLTSRPAPSISQGYWKKTTTLEE